MPPAPIVQSCDAPTTTGGRIIRQALREPAHKDSALTTPSVNQNSAGRWQARPRRLANERCRKTVSTNTWTLASSKVIDTRSE